MRHFALLVVACAVSSCSLMSTGYHGISSARLIDMPRRDGTPVSGAVYGSTSALRTEGDPPGYIFPALAEMAVQHKLTDNYRVAWTADPFFVGPEAVASLSMESRGDHMEIGLSHGLGFGFFGDSDKMTKNLAQTLGLLLSSRHDNTAVFVHGTVEWTESFGEDKTPWTIWYAARAGVMHQGQHLRYALELGIAQSVMHTWDHGGYPPATATAGWQTSTDWWVPLTLTVGAPY